MHFQVITTWDGGVISRSTFDLAIFSLLCGFPPPKKTRLGSVGSLLRWVFEVCELALATHTGFVLGS